jgi:O-antigen ligase
MAAAHQPELTHAPRPSSRNALAAGLLLVLFGSILTLWVQDRWALGAFQSGICLVAALAIVRVWWRGSQFRGSLALLPMAGVLALGALQLGLQQTTYAAATRESLLAWTANAALVWLAAQWFAAKQRRRSVLRLLFYFGFAVSVLALAQLRTSQGKVFWLFPTGYADFVMGPFVSRNLYSAFIELLLPVGLYYAISGRRAWLHWGMCGVMLASVVAGASRAGVVLAVSEVAAVLLLARLRGLVNTRAALGRLALLAGGCALLVALSGGTAVWERLRERDPYGARREMLRSSIDMVRERPWSGLGLGTWAIHYPRFANYDDGTVTAHAHNDWAEWAAEGGLPLAGLMLLLAAMTARRAALSLWSLGIPAVWLHCLVDSPLQNPVVAGWFFLILGIVAAQRRPKSAARPPGR